MECKIYYTRMVCAPDSVYETRTMIKQELLTGKYRIRNGLTILLRNKYHYIKEIIKVFIVLCR